MRSNDCNDVFSDIHVMKKKEIEPESDFSYDEIEEEESQAPKYKKNKKRMMIFLTVLGKNYKIYLQRFKVQKQ